MSTHEDPEKIMYFAETDARNRKLKFGIKTKDRSRHMYVIGKTGMGKSTLLENLAVQDIKAGHGMAFIDPHGKTADLLLDYIPKDRIKDVLYFAPFDLDFPVSFNVMEDVGADKRFLVANGLMSTFKKIWVDAWSARMEYILNNILLALLEYPDSTIIGVNRMLADEAYRNKVVDYVTDPAVKAFWVDEFAKYGPKYMQEAGAAIQNKIGQFISNPLIRNIVGQPKSTFDFRKIMDEGKIVIINLSKGRVGESNANLLGGMIITKIYLSAMSRADVPESTLKTLPNFYLFVDEFQNFANESFADILSEARKYKLNLIVAHQYIEQMTEEVRAAIFGNVGTMAVFRVGAFDAEFLEKEFAPHFTQEDLVNLGFAQVYLKLMIDGVTSRPFSATTLPPIAPENNSFRNEVIEYSRKNFALSRPEVEENIRKWHEDTAGERVVDEKSKRKSPIESALEAVLSGKPSSTSTSSSFRPSHNSSREGNTNPVHTNIHNKQHSTANPPHFNNNSRPVSQIVKQQATNEREKALRKAVSLSYLKQTGKINTESKDKKAPTNEHLADLRAALQGLVGGELISNPQVNNENKEHENSLPKTQVPEPQNQTKQKHENHQASTEEVKEIPEEVLLKILRSEE